MTLEERLKQFRDEGDTYSLKSLAGLTRFLQGILVDPSVTLDCNGVLGVSIRNSLNHKLIVSFRNEQTLDYAWFLPDLDTRKIYHGTMPIADFKQVFSQQLDSLLNEYRRLLDELK